MIPYKIAIWINNSFIPESGGGHSFLSRLIEKIDAENFGPETSICFIGFDLKLALNKEVISLPYIESFYQKKKVNLYHKLFGSYIPRKDIDKNFTNAQAKLNEHKVDIIFYPTPDVFIENFPFSVVNWDLGHRTTYPFPEMTMYGNWERRENTIAKNLGKALIICTESEEGKNEIVNNYHIPEDKIMILPLFPSKIVENQILPEHPSWMDGHHKFFLYPAQFWAHKNHYNLIKAFEAFAYKNKEYSLILPGSNQGNMTYIKNLIDEIGLTEKIIIPGFISDQELKWLYLNTVGLVFPSFLGPTNMPLLEAIELNCNVACSDLKGHQKMLGDLALYFDPVDPESIQKALEILKDKSKNAPDNPETAYLSSIYNIENALLAFKNVIIKSRNIRRTWGRS